MHLRELKGRVHDKLYTVLEPEISELRPSQEKAINAGLLEGKSLLVCTPTASGKTLIAELAMLSSIINKRCKALYIVPLKSLGSEKFSEFKRKYEQFAKVALSIGDLDTKDPYL